jgi:hypothetical protein
LNLGSSNPSRNAKAMIAPSFSPKLLGHSFRPPVVVSNSVHPLLGS